MFHTTSKTGRNLRKAALIVAATFALAWVRTAARTAPQPVSLYLNVEKGEGLIVGLKHENFRLYVDGQGQHFRLEKPEEPASVALLVEYSGSSGYFLEDLDASIEGFLKHAPEGHWYGLATYSRDLEIHTDFTKQIGQVRAAWSELGTPRWNDINTYDAVYEMLDKMDRLPGRRILIVVGSGIDSYSGHTLDEVKEKAESTNVTIFVAGIGSLFRGRLDPYLGMSGRMTFAQAQAFLQMLATKTGGFAWFPNQFGAFPDVMQGIMQSIATQYRLVYEPPPRAPGKFQKIKVEAFRIVNDKREDFRVLVREGWR